MDNAFPQQSGSPMGMQAGCRRAAGLHPTSEGAGHQWRGSGVTKTASSVRWWRVFMDWKSKTSPGKQPFAADGDGDPAAAA